ncbi:MAG: hypothetical protein K8S23_07775 [Candidatus Cloacimonetes bacterium]|nr:hypothetical protein [Candidatus Cloacimonadota bacterium]
MKKIILVFCFTLIFATIWAESLDEKMERFGKENGKMYLQPLVTAFGANLNSGFYNTAKVIKPFRFGVFFNTMAAFIPNSAKTFQAVRPDLIVNIDGTDYYVYQPEEVESATVFGDQGGDFTINNSIPEEINTNGMEINLPNGAELPLVPLITPQFHFGLPAGNELMFRFFPKTEVNKNLGEVSFLGAGIKHSLNKSLLKLIPIDLAVQMVYQSLKVGDLIDVTSVAMNAQISKKLLMWTIYGGLGYENTKLKIEYQTEQMIYNANINGFESTQIDIDFEIDGENDFRATAGIRYSMLMVKFYADYSLCKYPVTNVGFGVAF